MSWADRFLIGVFCGLTVGQLILIALGQWHWYGVAGWTLCAMALILSGLWLDVFHRE